MFYMGGMVFMGFNIALCDDDVSFFRQFSKFVEVYCFQRDLSIDLDTFSAENDFIRSCQIKKYDLIFLDIELSESNGIELSRKIRQMILPAKIIFVSNYPEYMIDSFSVHPYSFLQKPLNQRIVNQILSDVFHDLSTEQALTIVQDYSGNRLILHLSDIIYIQVADAKNKQLVFHTTESDILLHGIIKEWYERLKNEYFVLCHRGFIVNLNYIRTITGTQIILTSGQFLPLSHDKKRKLQRKYTDHIVRKHSFI